MIYNEKEVQNCVVKILESEWITSRKIYENIQMTFYIQTGTTSGNILACLDGSE